MNIEQTVTKTKEMQPPFKKCFKCNTVKPRASFYNAFDKRDGKETVCKDCKKEYRKSLDYKIRSILSNINNRCYSNCSNTVTYKLKEIKNYLSYEDVKAIWFRDKAEQMKKPSIDRKDNEKDYTYNNCCFIEMKVNSGKDKHKKIAQYTVDGEFIRLFNSLKEASEHTSIHNSKISEASNGNIKTAGGFIWRKVGVN